jgi:hypothetical protein
MKRTFFMRGDEPSIYVIVSNVLSDGSSLFVCMFTAFI